MTDYTLEDTIHIAFTTRQFSTGAPFTLAGTPVVSAYEDASTTQITAGITLGVDHDTVTGLNLLTIAATAANGYEAGKDYHLVITTGTVDSVSVVGEVVGRFTLGRSAAAVDLANGTDGLGAIKGDTAAILIDTTEIGTAGAGLTNINLPDQTMNITGNITGNLSGSVGSVGTGGITAASIATGAIDADALATDAAAEIATAMTTAMITDNTALGTGDIVAGSVAAIIVDATLDELLSGHTTAGSLGKAISDILADTNELQTDWVNGGRLDLLLDGVKAKTDQMTFTIPGNLDCNIQYVDDDEVQGAGTLANPWRAA